MVHPVDAGRVGLARLSRLVGLVGAVGLVACASSCARAPGSHLARVKAAGVLRWGGDLAGGEPYAYDDPAHPGHLIGFEVELADAVARELGVRAQFQQNEWSQLVPSLERDTFDIILNGLEVTPRTRARVALTRPYYLFAERLVARADDARFAPSPTRHFDGPGALSALAGLRVGTLANSMAHDLLRDTRAEVVFYDGVDTPYQDLRAARTDAVLLDDIIADRYGLRAPGLVRVGDVALGRYAIGCPAADEEFRAAVDAALARVAQSGELRRILEHHGLWSDRQQALALPVDDANANTASANRSSEPGASTAPSSHLGWRSALLFLDGAAYTLAISIAAMALAIPLGVLLALLRRYGPRPLSLVAAAYVELYRGTPVLLQLYVLYYGVSDVLRFGPLTAAVLGLGMNYAAYEAEVYRAGLQAVPAGQLEAALALGMTLPQALRRVVLPQAFRFAIPSVTNDFIALLKDSSLVSVITVVELTKRTQIAAVDGRSWLVPGLLCAGLYFAMSYPLARLARHLEDRP